MSQTQDETLLGHTGQSQLYYEIMYIPYEGIFYIHSIYLCVNVGVNKYISVIYIFIFNNLYIIFIYMYGVLCEYYSVLILG